MQYLVSPQVSSFHVLSLKWKSSFWNKYLLYQITVCLSSLTVCWQEGWARIFSAVHWVHSAGTRSRINSSDIEILTLHGQSDLNAYHSWLCRLHAYYKHFSCGLGNKHLYSCLAIASRITKGLCACMGARVCEWDCQQINTTATSV